MKRNILGLCIVLALVLGISVTAWATKCDEEDFFADFTTGLDNYRLDWWANLIKEIPINLPSTPRDENEQLLYTDMTIPLPDDFPISIDMGALGEAIWGTHTFEFHLETSADLINEVVSQVTVIPGEVTIELDMGTPGGLPYLDAFVAFGDVTNDCTGLNPLQLLGCTANNVVFNLMQYKDLSFTIDTISLEQTIDTCIIRPNGSCATYAEVSTTTAEISDFQIHHFNWDWLNNLLEMLTRGFIHNFIEMAFALDVEIDDDEETKSTLFLLYPYLITQSDGCSPPPEFSLCTGSACSTTPQVIMDPARRQIANLALYILPMALLFGLIIWRRRK